MYGRSESAPDLQPVRNLRFGAEGLIRRGVAELAKQVATAVTPSASLGGRGD